MLLDLAASLLHLTALQLSLTASLLHLTASLLHLTASLLHLTVSLPDLFTAAIYLLSRYSQRVTLLDYTVHCPLLDFTVTLLDYTVTLLDYTVTLLDYTVHCQRVTLLDYLVHCPAFCSPRASNLEMHHWLAWQLAVPRSITANAPDRAPPWLQSRWWAEPRSDSAHLSKELLQRHGRHVNVDEQRVPRKAQELGARHVQVRTLLRPGAVVDEHLPQGGALRCVCVGGGGRHWHSPCFRQGEEKHNQLWSQGVA